MERFNFDFSISFALIHHLAISKNIPLEEIIKFIIKLSKKGLIEFIPLEDRMVKQMTRFINKSYDYYNFENFIKILKSHCNQIEIHDLKEVQKKNYLL